MKRTLAIILGVLALLIVQVSVFFYYHPTHYSFNDRYVIGQPVQKIVDRYGEPDRITENTIVYMIRDDTPEWIMGYDNSLWYVIEIEENAAVEVYLTEGYPGG